MKPFIPSRVAETIYALILVYFGANHFLHTAALSGLVPSYMPGTAALWVYLSGGGLILAAIAIITRVQKTLACYLLAAMLIIFVLMVHVKNFPEQPANTLKDSAMAMCALLIGNRS